MAELMEYKCPHCGGAMEFDSKSQKMKCPFCDAQMSVEEFAQQENPAAQSESQNWQAMGGSGWQAGEEDGMRIYACQSCGGEIVAAETAGATTCPFCGNRVTMKEQFSGDLRPNFIIPFKLDKKDAKAAYRKHLSGKPFVPAVFKKENHIDEITGIYVPFWLFDADVRANIQYHAEKQKVWTSGDTEYTEHAFYKVLRAGGISLEHVPVDGSKKMPNDLMESIEPFDFAGAVPFQPAYLAGYSAERYDEDMQSCYQRADSRIRKTAESSFAGTVKGYHSVSVEQSHMNVGQARYCYALYPVWILNTTWKGKKFTFAMNGQTGKMVGDLPMDKSAFYKFIAGVGIGIGAALYALQWFIMLL